MRAQEKADEVARAKAERAALKAGASKEAALQKKLMPLVKRGEALEADGDRLAAIALYTEALKGFKKVSEKHPRSSMSVLNSSQSQSIMSTRMPCGSPRASIHVPRTRKDLLGFPSLAVSLGVSPISADSWGVTGFSGGDRAAQTR